MQAKRILPLIMLSIVCSHTNAFQHARLYRRLRVGYKRFEKQNREELTVAKSTIIENLESIVKDDIANDAVYFLKLYHLTNNDYHSYFYIVLYELMNVFLFKKRQRPIAEQIPISIASIVMYVFVKIVVLQNLFHHR